jgi:hypothetical protein
MSNDSGQHAPSIYTSGGKEIRNFFTGLRNFLSDSLLIGVVLPPSVLLY